MKAPLPFYSDMKEMSTVACVWGLKGSQRTLHMHFLHAAGAVVPLLQNQATGMFAKQSYSCFLCMQVSSALDIAARIR